METNNVSFGKVIAVHGKPKKMNKLMKKLEGELKTNNIMMRDVTSTYKNASPFGELARAAQNGEKVDIFITGNDIQKVNKEEGWLSLSDLLSHIQAFYDANKVNIFDILENII